ncbi:hypothetical protein B0A48_04545 [Cryoendolithus antarcticus]|uniref:Heterokaryon incompatibility domain-containing protein n=1 Tax=Cryoendolithus antarcticus TaxID=1507870 RepID=A0A1V8TG07_9PEZI|nr:hypothetical protein B0A48_04545 [Cryoendolithus antarcticus]
MRLINVDTLDFKRFYKDPPPYVIASHRWADETEETTFQDVIAHRNTASAGYKKLEGFIAHVRSQHRSIKWLWIDTCCIDKTNAVELSEAINSMYKWYRRAEVCLAYLADVRYPDKVLQNIRQDLDLQRLFERSEWFTRGWTLQELVAPRNVIFLAANWRVIGSRGGSTSMLPLEDVIASITHIPWNVLHDAAELESVNAEDRLQWASNRQTTREEDKWYCLYSLLDAPIGANYGEGARRARKRLLVELEDIGSIEKGRAATLAFQFDTIEKAQETLSRARNALSGHDYTLQSHRDMPYIHLYDSVAPRLAMAAIHKSRSEWLSTSVQATRRAVLPIIVEGAAQETLRKARNEIFGHGEPVQASRHLSGATVDGYDLVEEGLFARRQAACDAALPVLVEQDEEDVDQVAPWRECRKSDSDEVEHSFSFPWSSRALNSLAPVGSIDGKRDERFYDLQWQEYKRAKMLSNWI